MTITQFGILLLFKAGASMADLAAALECEQEKIECLIRSAVIDRERKRTQIAEAVNG